MCSYFAVIPALPWTMLFCNTNECNAYRGFLRTDDNRSRSLATIAVQRQTVGPSINVKCGQQLCDVAMM